MSVFLKVHSLGNDFILFDWYQKETIPSILQTKKWKPSVISYCKRHTGIGADGVLVLVHNKTLDIPEVFIFNADGSIAELCLNGARIVSYYLFKHYNFTTPFKIKMGTKYVYCKKINKHDNTVVNTIGQAHYKEEKIIEILDTTYKGWITDAGNPHLIIFEKTTITQLKKDGLLLEHHQLFPQKTNVEFIWPRKEKDSYNVLVHERGVGQTLACSSGACAIISTLHTLKKINIGQKINLHMPGGVITSWVDEKTKKINLQASAHIVFTGKLDNC